MAKYVLTLLLTASIHLSAQSTAMPAFPAGGFMPPMKTDESMTPNLMGFRFVPCSDDTKAAPGEAEVVLQLEIDPTGDVSEAKALSGPSRLQANAIGSVKQWKFKPFERDGKPVAKSLQVKGPFCEDISTDPEDQKVSSSFTPLFIGCLTSASKSADPAKQVETCGEAARQAEKFDASARFVERRSIFVLYSEALVRNKQYGDALKWAEKAVAVVKLGHDDNSGASAALSAKASAEAWLGNFVDANADLEEAEQDERAALASPVGEMHKTDYTQTLKQLLTSHAQVLSNLNRQRERDIKLEEAAKL